MNTRTASRAVALFFSALVTVVTLAGMDWLAITEHAAAQLAKAAAASRGA